MLYLWANTGQFEYAIYKAFQVSSDNKELQNILIKIREKDFSCLPSISLSSLHIMTGRMIKSIYTEETNSFYLDQKWSENTDNSILISELLYNLGCYIAKLLIGDEDDYSTEAMQFSNILAPNHLLTNQKSRQSVVLGASDQPILKTRALFTTGVLLTILLLSVGVYKVNNVLSHKKNENALEYLLQQQNTEPNRAELIAQTGIPFYANASSFLQYFNSRRWDDGIKRQFSNVGGCQKYTYSTTIGFHCRGGYVKEFTPAGESVCRLARMRYERSIDTGRERFIWINPEDEDGDERRDCNYL